MKKPEALVALFLVIPFLTCGSFGYDELEAPEFEPIPTELTTRPDVAALPFALRGTTIKEIEEVHGQLLRIARTVTSDLEIEIEIRDVERLPQGRGFEAHGQMLIALSSELDVWKRADRIARLESAAKQLAQAKKGGPAVVAVGEVQAFVRDPESFRARLVEQWVERARGFAVAAQTAQSPLGLVDCVVPEHVEQATDSLEEVRLSLSLFCRIDTAPGD